MMNHRRDTVRHTRYCRDRIELMFEKVGHLDGYPYDWRDVGLVALVR